MQFRLISVLGAGDRDGTVDDPVVGLTKFPHKKNLFEETFGCMVRVWTLR